MPLVDLGDLNDWSFTREVWPRMLHSKETQHQKQFRKMSKTIQAWESIPSEKRSPWYGVVKPAWDLLLHGPNRMQRALFAGEVLIVLRPVCEHHQNARGDEPSISKAIFVVSQSIEWSKHPAGLPKSTKALQSAGTDFRSVAHLWAVCALLKRSDQVDDFDPSQVESLPTFLTASEQMLKFGEMTKTRAKDDEGPTIKKSILNRKESWRFEWNGPLPNITIALPPLSHKQVIAYQAYAARRR